MQFPIPIHSQFAKGWHDQGVESAPVIAYFGRSRTPKSVRAEHLSRFLLDTVIGPREHERPCGNANRGAAVWGLASIRW